MRSTSRLFLASLAAAGWLLAGAARASASSTPLPPEAAAGAERGAAAVKARGKLVMLCFPHQENPFIRVDVAAGLDHYQGIDYEIMQGLAGRLGVALEVRPVKPAFSALVPALLAGDGDVIASSFSVTPERRQKVDFSSPYYKVHTVVVVRKGSGIKTAADLAGKTGSTVAGSSLEERIKQLRAGRIHHVEFTRWNYDAVSEKEADFTVLDESSTWRLLPLYPDLEVAFALPGADEYAYAVAPGSDLREAIDAYLEELRRSGRLDEIVYKHVGKRPAG
jgi:arginine/lysine/histidine transporter system substrate-binding protein